MSSFAIPTGAVPKAQSPAPSARNTPLAALAFGTGVLSFLPAIVLGAAIGWPASLGKPAAEQLAAIAAAPTAVATGYGLYLLYSILIAPFMIALAGRVFGGFSHPLAVIVAVFAGLSALARSIGILRWMTVMPELAQSHAQADAAGRAQIELVFRAITSYGGGIGELLGVSLLMAIALGALCVGALQRASMPKALSLLGVVCAALLLALFTPALGLAGFMPVAVAVSALSAWMLAVGVWALRR